MGELTRYADDFVVVCKTKKDAGRAYEIIRTIMERLELTLHPTKTRIVGLWTEKKASTFSACTIGRRKRKPQKEKCTTPPING
ncbi:reverse transcriptase domain-containing protein [Paenibacillus lentus]|uniref:reverse transcriptase domain-containing protein n=1 Tax=Paenibacillus lentus TaxID=1338368 RepID=UPI001FEA7C16|nr:reverse transcriptase domain-containing protein [Paenibacillus lentus]